MSDRVSGPTRPDSAHTSARHDKEETTKPSCKNKHGKRGSMYSTGSNLCASLEKILSDLNFIKPLHKIKRKICIHKFKGFLGDVFGRIVLSVLRWVVLASISCSAIILGFTWFSPKKMFLILYTPGNCSIFSRVRALTCPSRSAFFTSMASAILKCSADNRFIIHARQKLHSKSCIIPG